MRGRYITQLRDNIGEWSGARHNFKTYTLALTAGVPYPLQVPGDAYAVLNSSGPFEITFDGSNRFVGQVAGMGAEFPTHYSQQSILSPTSQTVVVVLGFGSFNDARATLTATINVTVEPADTVGAPADVVVGAAATLLVAADADRKEVGIKVPALAANSIRIGPNTVSGGSGLEVEPGQTVFLAADCALYGIRAGSSDVAVSLITLSRP